eukprot:SAG31_NODE_194_length_20722_cov_19.854192_3_plen_199_part_00
MLFSISSIFGISIFTVIFFFFFFFCFSRISAIFPSCFSRLPFGAKLNENEHDQNDYLMIFDHLIFAKIEDMREDMREIPLFAIHFKLHFTVRTIRLCGICESHALCGRRPPLERVIQLIAVVALELDFFRFQFFEHGFRLTEDFVHSIILRFDIDLCLFPREIGFLIFDVTATRILGLPLITMRLHVETAPEPSKTPV